MDKEANILLKAVREAGAAVLQLQKAGVLAEKKGVDDIVTKGDFLVNDILHAQLSTHFPEYGWLSEESIDDPARMQCARVWIIDPIDGTREFATNIPEYAISVALVENGEPILSVVFNPATNELFHAIKGKGAWLNDKSIHCVSAPSEKWLFLASRSEYKRGEWSVFERQHTVQQVGSIAYKLALVAAGKAHATFSLGPKNEWDIAAGVLLVTEAGGIVTTKTRTGILFNRENVKVNGIVATAANANDGVFALIAAHSI